MHRRGVKERRRKGEEEEERGGKKKNTLARGKRRSASREKRAKSHLPTLLSREITSGVRMYRCLLLQGYPRIIYGHGILRLRKVVERRNISEDGDELERNWMYAYVLNFSASAKFHTAEVSS